MKPRSQFGRIISMELAANGKKQVWLAEKSGINQGALSRIISSNMRPDSDTLRAICEALRDDGAGIRVLIAHLRDEVDRAGMEAGEIEIKPSNNPDLTEAAAIIDQLAKYDPDLLGHVMILIRNLARLVARDEPAPMIAADKRATYRIGKK